MTSPLRLPSAIFAAVVALFLCLLAGAETLKMPVSYGAVASLEAPAPDTRVQYGEHPLQSILRFDPSAEPRADVALIHGGCWSADYDRGHTLPLAGALRDAGYRVWVPEYRRVGDEGGGWPGTWEDIASALKLIAQDQSGGALVAVGHSAGGHLALYAATQSNTVLTAAIGLAPITDVGAYAAEEGSCQSMASKLIGVPVAGNEEKYRSVSPAFLNASVPVVVIQGEADPIVPMAQAAAMSDAQLVTVPEAGHFDLIHAQTAAFPVLLEAMEALIR